jgi:hypothetical protein
MPLWHWVPTAVQLKPPQQLWPGPPQVPQAPLVQVPGTVPQAAPSATHLPATQQPPCPQALPAQQASPVVPQFWPGGGT